MANAQGHNAKTCALLGKEQLWTARPKELLEAIDHHIQAGFVAAVTVARQIRDGTKDEPPSQSYISESAEFIRRVADSLRT